MQLSVTSDEQIPEHNLPPFHKSAGEKLLHFSSTCCHVVMSSVSLADEQVKKVCLITK